ncbi:MAG TPA: cytochrome c oxidase assembly protein [Streptosporangiaceae bacterium]|nr:cytochrome c oxidase assembly protein [Streptosporangiaceae bacterium]
MLPPFGLSAVLTHWQFAPIVTAAVVVSVGLYLWGVIRVARRHPARPWPAWRTTAFLGGMLVLVLATQSGIGTYDDLLFYDHMVQHLMLLMVAPPLFIAGQPLTLLLHASRNPLHTWVKRVLRSPVASFLTWPVFGAIAYALAVLAAHLSSLAIYFERSQAAHDAEHVLFVIVGYLFYLPLIGREPIKWRLSYPVRFVTLVLLMPVDTFTGLALGYGSANSPGAPTGPRPAWAPSPVSDLHLGGALMWIGGDGIMFVLMMLVFLMWSRDDRAAISGHGFFERARQANLATLVASHQPAESGAASVTGVAQAMASRPIADDRGGIDDDEHLAAYNAYLARLNQHPSGGARS